MVRRKRFQRGWLLKIGKRRKVWVGRWREDVLLEDGQVGYGSIATTLGIYTHAIDALHRKAVEEVEERLFGVMLRNGPKSGAAATSVAPVNADVA